MRKRLWENGTTVVLLSVGVGVCGFYWYAKQGGYTGIVRLLKQHGVKAHG